MLHDYFHSLFYNFRMSSPCIHITALLFKVEAVNRSGMTNPACTSRQCVWNVPSEKTRESNILSSDEIDAIEEITVGQADNEAWHLQREGRIIASNVYSVVIKVEAVSQAECTSEPLQPISTPRESNILSSDEADAID